MRYVGDPVAVVIAEDRYLAEDALELIEVEYQPLNALTDPRQAMQAGAPPRFTIAFPKILALIFK